jgi:hypothetical protein
MADVLSKKMGEPSMDAHDQLGTCCPFASLGRRHRVGSFGYQRSPKVEKVHWPAI